MLARAAAAALLLAACSREPPPAPAAPGAATPASPPSPAGKPAASEPDWGEPEAGEVKALFRARAAEVKRCYESALAQEPTVSGRFTLRFTIAESGALRDVSVVGSTFGRSAACPESCRRVPECVAEGVRRWRTPFRPAEPVTVEYPFRFAPR